MTGLDDLNCPYCGAAPEAACEEGCQQYPVEIEDGVARIPVIADHTEQADAIRQAVDFYESAIKSGEGFTETVMAVTSDALAALDALVAALATAEQRAGQAERDAQHIRNLHDWREKERDEARGWAENAERKMIAAVARADALARRIEEVRRWFQTEPWKGIPDPSSFGGGPYTPHERELGYGTFRDPRYLPAALAGEEGAADDG